MSKTLEGIIKKLRVSRMPTNIIKRCEPKLNKMPTSIIKKFRFSRTLLSIVKRFEQ